MMEADLDALLKTLCPRTFADVAEETTPTPYIVWQGIGGQSLRALDGAHCGERNTYMQVSVWADTRLAALTLIRQVEDALVASPDFQVARPDSEPLSVLESAPKRYGSIQRFNIWATR